MVLPRRAPSLRRRLLLRCAGLRPVCRRSGAGGRGGGLRVQRAELPGRPEVVLLVRNFAAHVGHDDALSWAKDSLWGYDETAEDMQFLTQWKHMDLSKLGDLLGYRGWAEDLWQKVAADGFGQMRWYGVDRETTRLLRKFFQNLQVQVIGRSRSLLRLGGDGFLTFHFESVGGRPGRLDLLLHHGDLVLMDRRIAGTKANGLQRPSRWRVTHRAGGLRARHCPWRLRSDDARSFVTLVWTLRSSRAEFLSSLPSMPCRRPVTTQRCWPLDPRQLDLRRRALRPWAPGLTLADRQIFVDSIDSTARRFAMALSLWFLTLPVAALASVLAPWVRFRVVFAVNGLTHILSSMVMVYIYHIDAPDLLEMNAKHRFEVGQDDEMQGFLEEDVKRSFGACAQDGFTL